MAVPAALRVAFDETVALHHAVCGHEATVTSFVEALVAEAHAGLRPPDVAVAPLCKGWDAALVEQVLARTTRMWTDLPTGSCAESPQTSQLGVLERFAEISCRAGEGDARELDGQIRALIRIENELEAQLGRLLCEMSDRGAWAHLMFAGVRHYAEERLGLGRTTVEGRVRLTRTLNRFPRLRKAYEHGRFGVEAALLVIRALGGGPVTDEVEQAWIERAGEATIKRLRDEVRVLGRQRLDGATQHPVDDTEWHGSLRHWPGDLRARVHELGRLTVDAGYSDVFLRLRLPDDLARGFLAAMESSRRALAAEAERVPWHQPWPDASAPASVAIARAFVVRCRRLPAWVGLLAMLEDFVDTWDAEHAPRSRSQAVYARDGWRCSAPGCTSRRNLEDHHVVYRSRGGDRTALSNRVCLCRFHHQRGEHGELASCRGRAPLDLTWRLGRRDVSEWFRNERRISIDASP